MLTPGPYRSQLVSRRWYSRHRSFRKAGFVVKIVIYKGGVVISTSNSNTRSQRVAEYGAGGVAEATCGFPASGRAINVDVQRIPRYRSSGIGPMGARQAGPSHASGLYSTLLDFSRRVYLRNNNNHHLLTSSIPPRSTFPSQ